MDSSALASNAARASRFRLSIVAPCYNEADGLREFHRQLRTALASLPECEPQILFVDDGSQDETSAVLRELAERDSAVGVLSLSRNFGHQIALTAGLDAANGDAVIMLDSDLQHPPALIPEMVARWQSGADIVSAVRQTTTSASWIKRATSSLFYRVINFCSDTYIVPGAADFCLLSKRAHQALGTVRERQRFLRGIVSWIGFNRTLIPFEAPARFAGKSSYGLTKMLRLATSAVISFSSLPLRIATRLGLLFSALGLTYLIYILSAWLFLEGVVSGWTSTISVVLILGGVQLVATGLLGEYLAVVYEETKRRPLYLLKDSRGVEAKPSTHEDA